MALWLKYPNPFSKHVLAGDIVDRYIDHLGRLCTTRVILKTSAIPAWISAVHQYNFVILTFLVGSIN